MLAEHLGIKSPAMYPDVPCADIDFKTSVDVFFPRSGGMGAVDETAAKAMCRRCPLATQCLEDALAEEARNSHNDRFGIRGGFTARERAALAGAEAA